MIWKYKGKSIVISKIESDKNHQNQIDECLGFRKSNQN